MIITNKKIQWLTINLAWLIIAYIFYKTSYLYQEQILVFIILWVTSINFILFKNKFLKTISTIWILSTWFFIVLGFLPLYQETPDWSNFYQTQQIEFLFFWNPKNVEIQETSLFWDQKIIPTQSNQKLFLIQSQSRSIAFNEKVETKKENNKLVIKFPDNTIYIIYPWSKISLTKSWNTNKITKEYWKVEYYQPNINQTHIINTNINEQKNKSEFSLSYIIEEYENQKIKHIVQQWWWLLITQQIYQGFSRKILEIANKIRPNIYNKNIENYKIYQEVLWREKTEKNYEEEKDWRNLFLKQIHKWRQETRHLK
jgi:hypothetical protein